MTHREASALALATTAAFALVSVGSMTAQSVPGGTAPPPLREGMRDHFVVITAVHDAVIRGDLDGVRQAAAPLATMAVPPGVPASAERYVATLRRAAARVAAARAMRDASTDTVTMLNQCAGCHDLAGVRPTVREPGFPDSPGLARHMVDYRRGVDALLDGLVVPSDERWRQGAARLATLAIPPEDWPDNPLLQGPLAPAPVLIRRLAQRALETSSPFGRANIYATIIETCGNCHRHYPGAWGPKPSPR